MAYSPTPADPIPTAGWLTKILRQAGEISQGVEVVDLSIPEDHVMEGLGGGKIVPYKVTYSNNTKRQDEMVAVLGPKTVIVKATAARPGTAHVHVAREAWFLNTFPVETFTPPRIHYSLADFGTPEGIVIVMEDLRKATTRLDQFHGGQGGSELDIKQGCSPIRRIE